MYRKMNQTLWVALATLLLLTAVFAVPAESVMTVIWEENFDGPALDSTVWNIEHATANQRWCSNTVYNHHSNPGIWVNPAYEACHGLKQQPPYGDIAFNNGLASFKSGYSRAFPYIWTKTSPFPEEGDFTLEFRMKYDSVRSHGDGISVVKRASNEPYGTTPPGKSNGFLSVWGDSGGVRSTGGTITDRYSFHIYRLERTGNIYSIYIDDVLRQTYTKAILPDTIWIGNPVFTFWGSADWSDFTIDYIRLSIPWPPGEEVAMDIKPGSCDNPFNTKAKGVLPVVIPGSYDLDAATIDVARITLNDVMPLKYGYEDVTNPDGDCSMAASDGIPDLVLHFDVQEMAGALGDAPSGAEETLLLIGYTYDGEPFHGYDSVLIKRPKK